MQSFFHDLRSGVRVLVKYRMLSIVAVLTLGLGIGLCTTVFCVVNGGLFKGLPFPDAGRVIAVAGTNPTQRLSRQALHVQDIDVMQQRQTAFESAGAFGFSPLNISIDGGRPERFSAGALTPEAFNVIKVAPILGRGFRPGDEAPGAEPVVLLGYELWRDKFGASPAVVGKTVRASGVTRTVIGVMPEKFAFPVRESLWIPLRIDPRATPRGEGQPYPVIARLKPGVTMREANAQVAAIAAQLANEFPRTNKGLGAQVLPYAEYIIGPEPFAILYTMLGAGIGVLLIACVNVSNLLIARASLRRKEVAVRLALGANRGRIVRQHLTEVLILALAGGVIGVGLAVVGTGWFTDSMSIQPPPFWMTFGLDWRVVAFVAATILAATLFAGFVPAWQSVRVTAGSVLKDDTRSTTSAKLGRFSSALVVAELALSCGLLITAGLMIKSVVQLGSVKMPFAVEKVFTARINLPRVQYPDIAASIRFYERLLPKLQELPGVEAATLSDGLPAAGNGAIAVQIEGRAYGENNDYPVVREGIVTPGYFSTFQTKLLAGREFTTTDIAGSQPVIIINEVFARQQFPGVDPIGRHVKRGRADSKEPWLTVVGVVPDMMMQGIGNNNQTPSGYYIPIAQSDVTNYVNIAVRTAADPASMAPLVRDAVASLDPDLAIFDTHTMAEVVQRSTWFYRVFGTFFMVFGCCALFLAAAGLYGVMSFAVTQRTREMGVRSALGANGGQLVRLVLRRSVVQLAIGLVLGLGLALAVTGQLQSLLYHVDARDPVVIAGVVVILSATCLVASFLPARRVTRIDPVTVLAGE